MYDYAVQSYRFPSASIAILRCKESRKLIQKLVHFPVMREAGPVPAASGYYRHT